MPQIDEVQTVWWGSLRPDTIELSVDGINVAAGPNGSGKTTFLDAIKLMLGVGDKLARRPAEYIYDGGGDPARKADRAYVRVIFANPERPGRAGRVFADAGGGCELVPYVTAVCEVSPERRRYLIQPGAARWGATQPVEADLHALGRIPRSRWLTPSQWSELLARAGVSQALTGVISIQQGETDRAITGTPEQLLRRVLELTGKQETLDGFRAARIKLALARATYEEASRKLQVEQRTLETLRLRAQRHNEFVRETARLERLQQVEIPAARHAELRARLETVTKERDGHAERLERDRRTLAELETRLPGLATEIAEVEGRIARLRVEAAAARDALQSAAALEQDLRTRLAAYTEAIAKGGEDAERADELEVDARAAERTLADTRDERDRLRTEREALEAGRVLPPTDVDAFRAALAARGITAHLVADHLDAERPSRAEAVLRDGVWALVVRADQFDEAVATLTERRYPFAVARAGEGEPAGALHDTSGMPDAGAFLAEVDLPVGSPGVSDDGLVRGRTWAAFRAPERPVLGERARQAALARVREREAEIASALPAAEERASAARARAEAARAARSALARVPSLTTDLAEATAARERAHAYGAELDADRDTLGPKLGQLQEQRAQVVRQIEDARRAVSEGEPRLESVRRTVNDLAAQLAALPLTEEQARLTDLPGREVLEHERDALEARLADPERYADDIRSELVLAQLESQGQTVAEVDALIGARQADLTAVEQEVDEARRRYDEHIRQVIALLARRFREVCAQAGMEGDIDVVPSEVEGEFGIDVKVAHEPGGRKRSYRNPAHSGGQKAKVAILLLLATMGLDGSADLLVMDEHIAHLDSQNIVYVAEVMAALRERVQFILATPANAEATRLYWCDHQLAFYPRDPAEPYAPPVRIFSRLRDGLGETGEAGAAAHAD